MVKASIAKNLSICKKNEGFRKLVLNEVKYKIRNKFVNLRVV